MNCAIKVCKCSNDNHTYFSFKKLQFSIIFYHRYTSLVSECVVLQNLLLLNFVLPCRKKLDFNVECTLAYHFDYHIIDFGDRWKLLGLEVMIDHPKCALK